MCAERRFFMKWVTNKNKVLFVCDYPKCLRTATHRWDFHDKHFCCEDHLKGYVREKVLDEINSPLDYSGSAE